MFDPNWMIWTGRRHKPHSECHNQFIGNQFWRMCYFTTGRLGRSLDYFLWGYVKSLVYANKPAAIDELRTNIEGEIAAVSADLCLKSRGGHAKEIKFH